MNAPEIRRASVHDAEVIAEVLLKAFVEYKALYTEDGFAATTPARPEILERLNDGPVWVALSHGKVVGTASVVLKGDSLYVRGMAVLPAARGECIGHSLLKEMEHYAGEQGCRRIFLSTTRFLARAIKLYERFGFLRTEDGPHDLFGTPLFTLEKTITRGYKYRASRS